MIPCRSRKQRKTDMKKSDLIIVGVLVVLMFGWMYFFPSKKPAPQPVAEPVVEANVEAVSSPPSAVEALVEENAMGTSRLQDVAKELAPEEFQTLENEQVELTVSSHGGAVVSAVLKEYPEVNEPDSSALTLDFSAAPALRYDGLPLSAGALAETADGLVYTCTFGTERYMKRTLKLEGNYVLTIEDKFVNSSDIPWTLPELRLPTGPMSNPKGTSSTKGISTLGVDTFAATEGVDHWSKKFRKLGKGTREFTASSEQIAVQPVEWVAAKNKFFVQILTPGRIAAGFDFSVRRDGEGKRLTESEVSAALQFDNELIGGGETFVRSVSAYIGPKEFSTLKELGGEQTAVMEFKSTGFWKFMNPIMYPIKLGLLWGLTHFAIFGSYGVAILILTVIVRVIFWPLTHKSTESMKRMQEVQPQLKAIQEKYKDNPQRMQQETMAFYKENKVNPMGGCLPMFIQIPVFIALFAVLRSAIELRFSKFLWISDLSEPENLFAGMFKIPLIGWESLNILPLLMSATMMWQQKLTPTAAAATPEQQQQQKMMQVMMPVMMLFFFYTMPSGLVLYWTTSQVIMIAQLLLRKKKSPSA